MADTKGEASLYAAQMGAAYLIETQRWDLAGRIFSMVGIDNAGSKRESHPGGEHAAHAPSTTDVMTSFATGYAAATIGSPAADSSISTLEAIARRITDPNLRHRARQVEIERLEVEALAASKKGLHDRAIDTIRRAVTLEEMNSPPSGPPDVIKPPHELCGELLLEAGRNQEAAQAFALSLARQPNRARSLLGRARAARAMGDGPAAAETYSEFLRIWRDADLELPELAEARKMARSATLE